jgi:hypothetical protein
MEIKSRDHLHELCSQALVETDQGKLLDLFEEINEILSQTLLEVDRVLSRAQYFT